MKLCSKEIALELKELGFDEDDWYCYITTSDEPIIANTPIAQRKFVCYAPRIDDACYWISDKYKIEIELDLLHTITGNEYTVTIKHKNPMKYLHKTFEHKFFKNREDALEYGLKQVIEYLKDKNQ